MLFLPLLSLRIYQQTISSSNIYFSSLQYVSVFMTRHRLSYTGCLKKLPQIYTLIAYICILWVAWFAVYICGNIWNALYVGFSWIGRIFFDRMITNKKLRDCQSILLKNIFVFPLKLKTKINMNFWALK